MTFRQTSGSTLRRFVGFVMLASGCSVLATCGLDAISAPPETFAIALAGDTTLVVGASRTLVPSASANQLVGVRLRWTSTAEAVVRVDSLTGEIVCYLKRTYYLLPTACCSRQVTDRAASA